MNFYPVYKSCRSTGVFKRIGSLMETCRQWNIRMIPYHSEQARTLFEQSPGDIILLGPRCVDLGRQTVIVERLDSIREPANPRKQEGIGIGEVR